jgi:hypothetical protein
MAALSRFWGGGAKSGNPKACRMAALLRFRRWSEEWESKRRSYGGPCAFLLASLVPGGFFFE